MLDEVSGAGASQGAKSPSLREEHGCYCGRDAKIGRTHRGVGAKRCQAMCEEVSECVAFEMYKGGNDCTLRPHCPNPRSSSIGTYLVLFEHRNHGAKYPEHMCRSPSTTSMLSGGSSGGGAGSTGANATGNLSLPGGSGSKGGQTTTGSGTDQGTEGGSTGTSSRSPAGGDGADGGGTSTSFKSPGSEGTNGAGDSTATTTANGTRQPVLPLPSVSPWDGNPADAEVVGPTIPPPPWGGVQLVPSTTCAEASQMLWNEGCEPEPVLANFAHTCQGSFVQEWQKACSAWYGSLVNVEQTAQACADVAARAFEEESSRSTLPPTSEAEAKLCFRCNSVTCVVRANYSGTPLPFRPDLGYPQLIEALSTTTSVFQAIGQWPADGSSRHCQPTVDGQVSGFQRRVRKEVHLWSDEEWKKFRSAIETMKSNGNYGKFAQEFLRRQPDDQPELALLQSLPWARRFLLDFETALQSAAGDCDLTLPFWSASLEASTDAIWNSIVWAPERLGGRPTCHGGGVAIPAVGRRLTGGASCARPAVVGGTRCKGDPDRWCLGNGLAAGWSTEADDVEDDESGNNETDNLGGCSCIHRSPNLNASLISHPVLFRVLSVTTDLTSLSKQLGAFSAALHCEVVGPKSTLCSPRESAWDPLFYLLHTNIDQLFLNWQRYRSAKYGEDTTSCTGCTQLLTHYGQPISDMLGDLGSNDLKCVLLPKSAPTICLSYQESFSPDKWW